MNQTVEGIWSPRPATLPCARNLPARRYSTTTISFRPSGTVNRIVNG